MVAWQSATWRAALLGRWMALILGTLMVFLFVAFFFGEGPPSIFRLTAIEKLQFAAMGAMFLGLAAAWKWEGAAGLLSLAGFAVLVAISRSHLWLWAFDLPAVIAAVHLVCWWRIRAGPPPAESPLVPGTTTMLALSSAFALFLFLCANEMFGQPPLMTPVLHPSGALLGVWKQAVPIAVSLTIHEDASVTGTVDGVAISTARITNGRSWFGKLLHWNTDYRIRGVLRGGQFSAPLTAVADGEALNGAIFRDNLPTPIRLRRN